MDDEVVTRRSKPRVSGRSILLMLAILTVGPAGAFGHGIAVDIAFYGGFTKGATQCLRRVTIEGRRCARRTYSLHRKCADQQLQGETCDLVHRDAELDAAMGQALNSIDSNCTGGQLTEIGLITGSDARNDMRQFCLRAEDVISFAYGPVQSMTPDQPRSRCAMMAGELAAKLFGRTLEMKGQAFDRMAVRLLTPSQKRKMLSNIGGHIGATRSKLVAKMQPSCPEFQEIYSASVDDFAIFVENYGNCALSFLYVQNAVTCP